jgi:hypothetical protein
MAELVLLVRFGSCVDGPVETVAVLVMKPAADGTIP